MIARQRLYDCAFLSALGLVILVGMLALAHAGDIPDRTMTPGEVASTDAAEVCSKVDGQTYSKRHRQTPSSLKDQVTAEYHGDRWAPHEIDHRVPLSLGGADTLKNLWYQPAPGYHCKDHLEHRVWEMVCRAGTLSLAEGQAVFLDDWRAGYTRYVGDLSACLGNN
jgi:hypothetical protein